jgi:hypothetical protein
MLSCPMTYATHPRILAKRRNPVQPVRRTSSTVRESQEEEHKRLHRALHESGPVTTLLPIMAVVLSGRDPARLGCVQLARTRQRAERGIGDQKLPSG